MAATATTAVANNNNNNNNNEGDVGLAKMSVDHQKYVIGLVPKIPHEIDTVGFTDANHWNCTLYAALASESDCNKWIAEFQDNTKTHFKADPSDKDSSSSSSWCAVYRCTKKKECPAKVEMKLLSVSSEEVEKDPKVHAKAKQFPCRIDISFYHDDHSAEEEEDGEAKKANKVQQQQPLIPEQQHFDNFFLNHQHTPDSQQQQQHQTTPSNPHQQPVVILNSSSFQPGEIFDIQDVERRLDESLDCLRGMLKKSGTSCAAVKQFVDRFFRLRDSGGSVLEDAMSNFGGSSVAVSVPAPPPAVIPTVSIPTPPPPPPPPPLTAAQPPPPRTTETVQIQSTMISTPQWTLTVDPAAMAEAVTPVVAHDVEPKREVKVSNKVNRAKNGSKAALVASKKALNRQQKANRPMVLPGQIDPVTGKRRKRSRCGTCQGCINRDKTQDCRVCRNCLDQKRYGGPGKLKKACVRRSCAIMATSEGQDSAPTTATSTVTAVAALGTGPRTSIALPTHPLPQQQQQQRQDPAATTSSPVTLAARTPGEIEQQQQPATTATVQLSWPNGTQFLPTFQVSNDRSVFHLPN